DCCAPGVAVVSGLPPAGEGPVSGPGIAAAHGAAAAVLVLAHHPQFGPQVSRDARRVDQLFNLILAFCRPLPALGRLRSGAGLPYVPAAVGVAPWGNQLPVDGAAHGSAPSPSSRTQEDRLQGALAPLDAAMQSAGLIPGWRGGRVRTGRAAASQARTGRHRRSRAGPAPPVTGSRGPGLVDGPGSRPARSFALGGFRCAGTRVSPTDHA